MAFHFEAVRSISSDCCHGNIRLISSRWKLCLSILRNVEGKYKRKIQKASVLNEKDFKTRPSFNFLSGTVKSL